jgi:hypothetical protein
MKTFIVVVTIAVIAQAENVRAQNPILGVLKDWATGQGARLATNTAQKILNSFLPEDIHALTNGNVLTMQGGSWKQVTVTNLQEPPKQYLVRVPASESKQPGILSSERMVLDEKVVQGKVPGRLALQLIQSPLQWNAINRAYATEIQVGLQAEGKKITKLDTPITINLTGNNADVNPATLKIISLGQNGFLKTRISCARHDVDAKVVIHSDWGDRSFDIPVGPHTSQLKVSVSEKKIFGYGLGTAVLTIKRMAEDGKELSDSNSLVVNLSAEHGKLDSSSVTIPAGRSHGEVKLRSVGLGATKLSVESDSYKEELSDVQFVFPVSFMVAALAGGCLGGVGRHFKDFKAGQKKGQKTRARYMCEGCVVGFVIVAAVAAGAVIAHLPTTVIGTELGALVIAMAGGYSGAPILDQLKPILNLQKRADRTTTRRVRGIKSLNN